MRTTLKKKVFKYRCAIMFFNISELSINSIVLAD